MLVPDALGWGFGDLEDTLVRPGLGLRPELQFCLASSDSDFGLTL